MPVPAGPAPQPTTTRPNTGRVVRPVSGTAPDEPGQVQ
jgi:hypothetical protein